MAFGLSHKSFLRNSAVPRRAILGGFQQFFDAFCDYRQMNLRASPIGSAGSQRSIIRIVARDYGRADGSQLQLMTVKVSRNATVLFNLSLDFGGLHTLVKPGCWHGTVG